MKCKSPDMESTLKSLPNENLQNFENSAARQLFDL